MEDEYVDYGYDWCQFCGAEFYCSARDHEETCEYNPATQDEYLDNKLNDLPSSKSAVNREDRVNRIQPQLSCSYCPPNRHENANYHEAKNRLKNKPKKQTTKERNRGRNEKYGKY